MPTPKKSKGTNKGWDNLKPAKKGEVRNPNGRPPKVKCIPDILKRLGEMSVADDPLIPPALKAKFAKGGDAPTKLEAVMQMVYIYALQGKSWAVEYLSTRTEGKPVERIEVNKPEPITISIISGNPAHKDAEAKGQPSNEQAGELPESLSVDEEATRKAAESGCDVLIMKEESDGVTRNASGLSKC